MAFVFIPRLNLPSIICLSIITIFAGKLNPVGRVLAIDYGKKRVGIAVTDPLQLISTRLTTVQSNEIWAFLSLQRIERSDLILS